MFVVFAIGLLLLIALFGVKSIELKRGQRIFLAHLRSRADDRFARMIQQVRHQTVSLYGSIKFKLTKGWRSTCRWIADRLHNVARQIHN